MKLSDFLRPFRDAEWRRVHVWQHLAGGVVWALCLQMPPFGDLDLWSQLFWVTFIQAVWERYQREYDPTYPVWSMVWDTGLAVVGGAVTLGLIHLFL